MLLTFKTTINLSKEQEEILDKISHESTELYNYFLNQKIEYYNINKKTLSYYTQQLELKDYKTSYLTYDAKKEILRNLDANYKSFFKLIKKDPKARPPKFRSTKYFFTLSYIQDFIIKDDNLIISLPNYQKLSIKLDYTLPIANKVCLRNKTTKSNIKQLKVFKVKDKYFASIVYEQEEAKQEGYTSTISIDLGKKNLATVYDMDKNKAIIYDSSFLNKNIKYYDKRIEQLKSIRDKKTKNSNRYNKIKDKITKLYNKKKTQQKLTLHKLSKTLSNYNVILGDLTNLKKNTVSDIKAINKQMQNNWALMTFVSLLEYKTKLKGNQLIKVNEAWTSKTCSNCGRIMEHQTLSNREYQCECGIDIDRDVNGAINILARYLGDYNTPIDYANLVQSRIYDWSNIRRMNGTYRVYNSL